MTIGIDLDDTLVNTRDLLKENWKKYIEENKIVEFTSELPDDINRFGNKIIDTFWDQYREEMAYPSLIEGAKEVINKLHEEGAKIIIISFRKGKYITDPYMLTKNWLDRHGIHYDKIYVDTGSKVDECVENEVNLFIDDKESHCEDVSGAGIDVLLFTNQYNHAENRFKRVDSWYDVEKYIKEKYNG